MAHLVVVGGNAAGMSCASKAKRRAEDLEVTVLEAGEHISYSTCGVPYWIEGIVKEPDVLYVLDAKKAKERGIDVRIKTRAVAMNPYTKSVVIEGPDGRDEVRYDKLCIAVGTKAANPFAGGDLRNVFGLRSVDDGVRMMDAMKKTKAKTVGIVGGGYVGLEMAEAFHKRGLDVHLFHRGSRLLNAMDDEMTDGLAEWLGDKGINVHMNTTVKGFAGKDGAVDKVLGGKKDVSVDAVLVAVGVKPVTEWVEKAKIAVDRAGYILVDDNMHTNLHDVWAAGDCVAARHIVTGRQVPMPLALPSNRMGRVAGDNIAATLGHVPGPSASFPGVLGTTITRLYGLALAHTGISEREAKAEGFDPKSVLIESNSKAGYMPGSGDLAVKIVGDTDSGKILGVQIAGPEDAGLRINAAAVAIQAGMTVRKLADVETAYAPPFSPVWDPLVVAAGELAKELGK